MISYGKLSADCGCMEGQVFYIVGDGATTDFALTHDYNTKNLIVQVQQQASPFALVTVPTEFTSATVVTLKFAVAPALNEVFVVQVQRTMLGYTIAGNGVTTAFTITHNLKTRNVIVSIRENFGSYRLVAVPTAFTSINAITVTFGVAPAAGVNYIVSIEQLTC